MAVVFAIGWELAAPLAHYTNSGWTVGGGTPDPRSNLVTAQHPIGYGGGERSLRLPTSAFMEAPSVFSAPTTCTINSMLHAASTFMADGVALRMLDTNGDTMAEVKAADAGGTTRLAILHAGVTVATTSQRLSLDQWYRLALGFQNVGPNATLSLYLDGELRAGGTTTMTTTATAEGVRWGSISEGNTFHDHTVVYDVVSATARDATWIQGLRPNGDDTNNGWTGNPPGSTWSRVEDANDANEMQSSAADWFNVNLQGRSDVDAAWTSPAVRAVQMWVNGNGDGALDDGCARLKLSAALTAGLTVTMNAGGSLATVIANDKPGGSGWAASDLDNLSTRYDVA